jgi:hypothetical protein
LDLSESSKKVPLSLTATAQFHSQMYQAYKALDQEVSDRMLIIAGVGYKTLFRLAHEPRFFGPWKQMTKVISRVAGDPHREGEGASPLGVGGFGIAWRPDLGAPARRGSPQRPY